MSQAAVPRAPVDEQPRLAVLIDADNAQAAVIDGLLAEVARYGVASVKRIYGDFTSQRLAGWKQVLLKHSIHPVQQFAYTTGKNATDSSLIIDAMDLMYTGRFDGFCLVSSDSDFTRLAQRLREAGLTVYGFGERKTPDPFVQACDKFVYTEILRQDEGAEVAEPAEPAGKGRRTGKAKAKPARAGETTGSRRGLRKLLDQAIEEADDDDDGWVTLASVGNYLGKLRSDFDPRLYGHKKLSDLFRAHPDWFELRESGTGSNKAMHVRSKR
jgi:uncharacterized LabA/DUF88 family protein